MTGAAPESLCIIRLSAIGDTCHTVPVVRAIQAAWPETAITWVIGRVEHGLLDGLDGVRFAVLDKRRGWRGYADLRRQLGGHRFPLMLHMHASSRANLASLMVSSPVRLGFDRARARDFQYWFCNRHIPARPRQHVMDGLFEFAGALGIARGELRWDIPVSDDDRAEARRSIPDGQPALVVSPCTGQRFRNFRNWRADRYAAVADHVAKRYGAVTLLTGGSTELERGYGREIERLTRSSPVDLIGRTSLKQLLALIARASVVVCPDSGPAHMATAVGTPVVGLYATSNRFRTGPYSSQHLVADKYPEAVHREFGKGVDEIRWGRRVRDPAAMDLIEVGDVVEKLELAFAERGIAPLNCD
jgi:heptosyltransferase I